MAASLMPSSSWRPRFAAASYVSPGSRCSAKLMSHRPGPMRFLQGDGGEGICTTWSSQMLPAAWLAAMHHGDAMLVQCHACEGHVGVVVCTYAGAGTRTAKVFELARPGPRPMSQRARHCQRAPQLHDESSTGQLQAAGAHLGERCCRSSRPCPSKTRQYTARCSKPCVCTSDRAARPTTWPSSETTSSTSAGQSAALGMSCPALNSRSLSDIALKQRQSATGRQHTSNVTFSMRRSGSRLVPPVNQTSKPGVR